MNKYGFLITVLFSEKVEKSIQNYSKNYAIRVIPIIILTLFFTFFLDNVFYCVIFAFGVEWHFVDIYTERLMPPAFLCKSKYLKENENSDDEKVLFLLLNGLGSIAFILFVLFN